MYRIVTGLRVLFSTAFPNLYIAYCLFWVLGLEGVTLMTMGASSWELGLPVVVRIFTVYFSLLFLTFLDEVKDFEYDKKHNPDRVLVVGLLTARELLFMALVLSIVLITLNAIVSKITAVILIIDFIYALALWSAEHISRTFRNNVLLNLVFTYPVQLLLSIYIVLSIQQQYSLKTISATWFCVIAVMLAYLHFEFSRKSAWDKSEQRENFYSSSLGAKNAGFVTLTFGVGAIAIMSWISLPHADNFWHILAIAAIWAPGVPLLLGSYTFFSKKKSWPVHFSSLFLLSFLLALSFQATMYIGITI